ncbi:hypothetical protein STEG23_003540 [Scotinomys teguina]
MHSGLWLLLSDAQRAVVLLSGTQRVVVLLSGTERAVVLLPGTQRAVVLLSGAERAVVLLPGAQRALAPAMVVEATKQHHLSKELQTLPQGKPRGCQQRQLHFCDGLVYSEDQSRPAECDVFTVPESYHDPIKLPF